MTTTLAADAITRSITGLDGLYVYGACTGCTWTSPLYPCTPLTAAAAHAAALGHAHDHQDEAHS